MVAVYKSGMGTRGRVCGDLWTRDEGLGDIKYGTPGGGGYSHEFWIGVCRESS